jgi:flavin-dependent dehydrogenase
MTDILVIGAGPAGVLAALRAADLGAQTALVTSGHSAVLPDLRGILVSVAVKAAHEFGLAIGWQAH